MNKPITKAELDALDLELQNATARCSMCPRLIADHRQLVELLRIHHGTYPCVCLPGGTRCKVGEYLRQWEGK